MKSIPAPRSATPNSNLSCKLSADRVSLPPQLTKGAAMPRKKEETIEDIVDRIEADLEMIRDKAIEKKEWEDEDEDEDIDEDEDDEDDE